MWKSANVSVVPIVSKFLETTGMVGTIQTIIWKPGVRVFKEGMEKREKGGRKHVDQMMAFALTVPNTSLCDWCYTSSVAYEEEHIDKIGPAVTQHCKSH